ncbi:MULTISPECIES: tetratricopeptide repeat protein [unclassified Kaistella]|uniref:tetratricopeptide repeat protein n=1 Tax=unclassified Kaistella TaxID=2762626 RepID=UPI002733374F|nr:MULTISPECIES: tetratricopeptide repeat protein [unclassified Kaistella]MCZ2083497.1 tetratricopeptide repeat protein [Flavobacteriales bacterium]MDP2455016.1 tetratricopeptide repeat protein [Kaistella sp. SH11-4b]MDP2456001.1 tetratricopeptide repeat protein [Kaistella sp. SH40-3]MDP2460686.1 tetratricopeptide repeat protein [Kaistella sp. SH19-2b]
MAKFKSRTSKKEMEGKETVEVFRDLDKGALDTERFLEKHAKTLITIFGALLVAVLGYFAYQQFYEAPRNEEATLSYLAAQKNMAEGKEDLALGGKSAANPGYLGTYNEYSGTKVGKLSSYNAGLIKFKAGKYQEAYDLIDNFSSDNKVLMALKYGAMADCQLNLNKNDDALSLLNKAISASDDPYTTYYFTRKAGIVALALKKNADAKKYFSTIEEKYEDYDNGMSDSYIEMVKYY